jgi:hypothetical protein
MENYNHKGIEEKNRKDWNYLLDKFQINVRHAANELNFQVDDNSIDALKLKHHLVKYLNDDDTRTFGVCIGIKTKMKSEVFSSILVRRKPLIRIGKFGFLYLYDILCAKDFNPNERTGYAIVRTIRKYCWPSNCGVLSSLIINIKSIRKRKRLSFGSKKNNYTVEKEGRYCLSM